MTYVGERVTPLVSNPGRIMLTSSRIYFQPFNNVEVVSSLTINYKGAGYYELILQDPVIKLELSSLTYAMKRRYMLRHVVSPLINRSSLIFIQ